MKDEGDGTTALVHETFALLLALETLGIPRAEMAVEVERIVNVDPPGLCVTVTITRGDACHVVAVGRLRDEAQGARYIRAWNAFVAEPVSREQAIRIVRASKVIRGLDGSGSAVLTALVKAGFELEGHTLQ